MSQPMSGSVVAVTPAAGRDGRRGRKSALRTVLVTLTLTVASLAPNVARAADDLDEDKDGRFIGYGRKEVALESRSTTLTYLAFFGLAVIGCIPLFKAAKRD